jgi:hypothetical protein
VRKETRQHDLGLYGGGVAAYGVSRFSTNETDHSLSAPRRNVANVDAGEHWQAWLDRYGDDYSTDDERRAAYRDFQTNLAQLNAAFSASNDPGNQ